MFEPGGTEPSDLLRFTQDPNNNGNTLLFLYSDASAGDPPDAPADVLVMPSIVFLFTLGDEIGLFGNPYSEAGPNGLIINVNGPRPGWDLNPNGTQYTFVSDGVIPEPSSLALLAGGLGILCGSALRRRNVLS